MKSSKFLNVMFRRFWWVICPLVLVIGAVLLQYPPTEPRIATRVENKALTIQNSFDAPGMCFALTNEVAGRVDIKNDTDTPLKLILVGLKVNRPMQVHSSGYAAHGSGYSMTKGKDEGILVFAGSGCLEDLNKIYKVAKGFVPSANSIARMEYSGIPRSRWIIQEP